jgi:eukaryotic-like serine/threonine-protein kinase
LELEAASRVRHPGVVRISAVGFDELGEFYLVSDFVEGKSLRLLMSQARDPAMGVFLRHMELIAAALHALHEAGVVHRDLKPENVIVTSESLPVLVDFGIAHIARYTSFTTINSAGTPAYMAPEQAKGAAVDGRADLYALGVIAYEWLTGELPIRPRGTDLRQIAFELTSEQPVPLNQRRPDLTGDLSVLVMSLLAKDAGDRPASASAVMDAFRKISQNPPLPTAAKKLPANQKPLAATEPDIPR